MATMKDLNKHLADAKSALDRLGELGQIDDAPEGFDLAKVRDHARVAGNRLSQAGVVLGQPGTTQRPEKKSNDRDAGQAGQAKESRTIDRPQPGPHAPH